MWHSGIDREKKELQEGAVVRIIAIVIILISGSTFAFAATAMVLDVFDGDTLIVEIQGEKLHVKLY
jgi:hypothetical protein